MIDKPVLNDLAPYPRSAQDATAEAMARHFTAFARLHWRLAMEHLDRGKTRQSVNSFTSYYAIAYLLREQRVSDGDQLAKELWETWGSGLGVGADLWNWLEEYRIDPGAVDRIATRLISEDSPSSSVHDSRPAWPVPPDGV